MLIIKIDGKKSIDNALKNLKNKFIKTGISKELLERKTFKKKSIINSLGVKISGKPTNNFWISQGPENKN